MATIMPIALALALPHGPTTLQPRIAPLALMEDLIATITEP